ncbi:MAG: FHA domain-containing protein [Lachnospiraceae bacterium]|nr:FHA domain-containing protein [Lachnospiraceae bacterium]
MSRSEEYYYHCPKCKKWVPATERRCSCGQFLDHLTPVFRPQERQSPKLSENRRAEHKKTVESEVIRRAEVTGSRRCESAENGGTESVQNYPALRCSRCGKTFYTDGRTCPDCGGILLIGQKEESEKKLRFQEEAREKWPEESLNSREDAEEDYGEAETELAGEEEYEEESGEEKPLFYFNACRYDNGAAIAANMGNIPVCVGEGEKMLIGRNLFIRDPRLFFSAGNKEIDARYRTVSRNNALLFVEDKKLYVELYREDGATKAAVYVNEEKLGSDEVRELQDGDRIRLGGRKTVHDGTIDLEIVSAQEKERRARNGDPESMMRVMTEMRRDLAQLQGDVTSIWEFVARINPADLVVRRGEDAEAYENRLEASVPEAAYPTREECVAGFLEAVVERDSGKYRKKMEFFQENDRRFHLLYQAAFFERACEANGLEDYAGPMSFLGKAMEGFVMGEIAEVVKTFHREAYKVLFAQKGNWINQSDILGLCRQNGGIQKILLAAGYDEKERKQLSGRVNNALNVLHDVRKARNATSHCDPDTERPSDSKVDAITRQGYEKIKKKLLSSDAVEVMHDLYLRAKQRKDPA